jgi:phospholipid/cholesterol/gamma-HCH transport system ATP-binding protein
MNKELQKISDEAIIEFDHVSFSYDTTEILTDVSFTIKTGENISILGPSGSGKSTILKLITGLMKPDSGKIMVLGQDITALKEEQLNEVRRSIGLVFQGGALFDSLTVAENVGYRLYEEGKLPEQKIREIVLEKLRFVGLEDTIDLMPSQLSGGMKKRVAIARALAGEPAIMLYDEPTTGLDPVTAKMVAKHILELERKGEITTIVVTHDIYFSFLLTRRIIMIHNGKKIFDGTREEIRKTEINYINEYLFQEEI